MPFSELRCPSCKKSFDLNRTVYICPICGDLLDVVHKEVDEWIDERKRGVWRYKNLIHPTIEIESIVTRNEGNTMLYSSSSVSEFTGARNILMKHDGENPTGSFKDRGMTVAISEANRLSVKKTICASTGNTSASASSYSSLAGMESYVFIPDGLVSQGKLAQAIGYGAKIVSIDGDFDQALSRLTELVNSREDYYILNSLNPWRLEGQKSVLFEIIEEIKDVDYVVVPAGNLGNTSSIGKAIIELSQLGIIEKIPKIVAVQASGASPFYNMINDSSQSLTPMKANTIATAINIGNPVNWKRAVRAIRYTKGIVTKVTDEEILSAKKTIDNAGIGCEPASAASVAGVKKLIQEGAIEHDANIVSILTGNMLKDTSLILKGQQSYDFNTLVNDLTG